MLHDEPRPDYEVKEVLNRDMASKGLLDSLQNLKLDNSSYSAPAYHVNFCVKKDGKVTHPSRQRILTPASSGLNLISAGSGQPVSRG